MIAINDQYVIDKEGNIISVLLDRDDCQKLLAELEELESIRAYDEAKASHDEAIPPEQPIYEIK